MGVYNSVMSKQQMPDGDLGSFQTLVDLVERLRARGVESRPSYPLPVHHQVAFAGFGRSTSCPVAEALLPQMLELPVHPRLMRADLEAIAAALQSLAKGR